MHTLVRSFTRVVLCLALALTLAGLSPGSVSAAPAVASPAALTFAADGAHFAGGWGMHLAAVRRGDALTATDAVLPTDDGNRAEYRHAGNVTEWYVRGGEGADGVEQGVTLATRPAGVGPLALTVVTPGAMALVDDGGATATFVLPDGTQWAYTGLHVTDTAGRSLPASLTQAAGGIGITVDDTGAVYPVTVDPFVQRQTLTATGGASGDYFGSSVALSADGSTALVGAFARNTYMGAAYVFTRSGSTYSQTAAFADPAGGANYDEFGSRVALSADGNTALIGAQGRSSNTGAAYVFTRSNGVYSQTATFTDPAAGANYDYFGRAVALSADGNTALVGASGRNTYAGAAYVFTRSNGVYSQTQALTATGGAANDQFGVSVALSADGSTALVGAYGRSSSTGAAYVFTRSSGVYSQTQALTAASGANYDYFGYSVALTADGSTALVGATGRSSNTGAASVFTRSSGVYSQTATLTDPPGGASGDYFGYSVALTADGSTALVGAYGRNTYMGAAYVFTRSSGSTYSQTAALADPAGGATNDYFGISVALSADGSAALVGAYGRSSFTGAAYVFTNAPALSATGGTPQYATVGQPFAAPLAVALSDSYGTPLVGVTVTFTALAGGASGTFGGAATATATTDANGLATAPTFTGNTVAGNYTVTASATTSGGTASTVFSLANTAGAPASITAMSGGNQTAQLGTAFAAPLTVQVRDQYTNPVPGVTVAFAAPTTPNTASATLSGPTAVTNGSGLASVNVTAAGRPGVFSVTASVSGVAAPASFTLSDTANSSTVLVTGFSPITGPTTGGNTVTLTGVNFAGATGVTFDTAAAGGITVVNPTTITVTAPAHAAGTVDITVATNGQTATIHGYTYVNAGGIAPQPTLHPLPGSGGSGGSLPMAQPARHDDPGNGGAPRTAGSTPTAVPTPEAQPARH